MSASAAARRSRARAAATLVVAMPLIAACYSYVPPTTSLPTNAPMRFELSDEGRVTHAPTLGPGILQVNGTLQRMEGDRYVVAVGSVKPIRGPQLPVDGIRVTLGRADLADTRVRTLSRKRTGLLIGGALAVIATFLIADGFSAGYTPPEGPPDGGPDQSRGVPTVICCR